MDPLPQRNNRNNEAEIPYTHTFVGNSGMGQQDDKTESDCAGLYHEQKYFLDSLEDTSTQDKKPNKNKERVTVFWYPLRVKKNPQKIKYCTFQLAENYKRLLVVLSVFM